MKSIFRLPLLFIPLFLLTQIVSAQGIESASFTTAHVAVSRLLRPPNIRHQFLHRIELQFRTSQYGIGKLLVLEEDTQNQLIIGVTQANELSMTLSKLALDSNITNNRSHSRKLKISAPGVANGEWHHLSVTLEGGWRLLLDSKPLVDWLPDNASVRFPFNNRVKLSFGQEFRGCLANVTLNGAVVVPLHSNSKLLNQTDFLLPVEIERLPNSGPGCRQSPCLCKPNGICVYRQWDLVDRCSCRSGYTSASLCDDASLLKGWNYCRTQRGDHPLCLYSSYSCKNLFKKDLCTCTKLSYQNPCRDLKICLPITKCQKENNCFVSGARTKTYQPTVGALCQCVRDPRSDTCQNQETITDSKVLVRTTSISVTFLVLFLVGRVSSVILIIRRRRRSTYDQNYGSCMFGTFCFESI